MLIRPKKEPKPYILLYFKMNPLSILKVNTTLNRMNVKIVTNMDIVRLEEIVEIMITTERKGMVINVKRADIIQGSTIIPVVTGYPQYKAINIEEKPIMSSIVKIKKIDENNFPIKYPAELNLDAFNIRNVLSS